MVVADVLGFSEHIDAATTEEKMQEALDKWHSLAADAEGAFESVRPETAVDERLDWFTKSYTDNFLLRTRLRADGEQPLEAVIIGVQRFQCAIVNHNFLCRGGMSLGLGYATDAVVFGHALLDAHRLEQNVAIVPRIVLSHSVCRLIARQLNSSPDTNPPLTTQILEDSDGQWFVNYLAQALKSKNGDTGRVDASILEDHQALLVEGLSHHDRHVRAKYTWAAVYHNWFLKHNNIYRRHSDLEVYPRNLALPRPPTTVRKATIKRYIESYRRRLRDGEDMAMPIGVRVAARRRPSRAAGRDATSRV